MNCQILLPIFLVYVCKSKGEFDIRSGVTQGLIPCTPSNILDIKVANTFSLLKRKLFLDLPLLSSASIEIIESFLKIIETVTWAFVNTQKIFRNLWEVVGKIKLTVGKRYKKQSLCNKYNTTCTRLLVDMKFLSSPSALCLTRSQAVFTHEKQS